VRNAVPEIKGVFEKRVLRTLGHKRERIVIFWRKLHNGDFHKLQASSNIIK
jgi:hypothetical protein